MIEGLTPAAQARLNRPSWDEYFLAIARVVATRSACFRQQCGAVIVLGKVIVATGYNGAPVHQPNCQEIGFCYRDRHQIQSGTHLELCRAAGCHAETNAVAMAARSGHATEGATIYVVGHRFLCVQCMGQIANAGIERVVFEDLEHTIHEYIPARDWVIHPVDVKPGITYDCDDKQYDGRCRPSRHCSMQ